ncbi:MAG TPA: hypothetical protein VNF68_14310, partial [Candidatus Baltobacteraceae bacterium]|nr:hypothetical protein [Candidatus Baltobacteraceae bacterium]
RCLEAVLDLYRQPRGFERFQGYLDLVRTQTGTMALPLSMLNPMAKSHAVERIEQLLAARAEDRALEAAREAAARFEAADDALRTIVVLVDDALGGWTNRAFAEFAYRYERKHEVEHGWSTVIVWTSEEPTPELIATRAREAIYRTSDERKRGPVRTLREILEREGRTMRFAGHVRRYDDATIAVVREKAAPHMDSTKAPALFALLYGDETAESLGYPALGVPERGGYDLALADATRIRPLLPKDG